MADVVELGRLVHDGVITGDEMFRLLRAMNGCGAPPSASLASASLSSSSSPPPPSLSSHPSSSSSLTSMRSLSPPRLPSLLSSRDPAPQFPSAEVKASAPFRQTTLWNHGAAVKRKLADGSELVAHDASGLPRRTGIDGRPHMCASCTLRFSNHGALSNHQRWAHPSDRAELERRRITTSSSSSSSSSTTTTSLTSKSSSSSSTTSTSTTSASSTVVVDDEEPTTTPKHKKQKRTHGASRRRSYKFKTKWVRSPRSPERSGSGVNAIVCCCIGDYSTIYSRRSNE
jgi:hypothetical protein